MSEEKFIVKLHIKDWDIYPPDDLPNNLLGKIMLDIAFCDSYHCSNKKAYLKLLKETAIDLIRLFIKNMDKESEVDEQRLLHGIWRQEE